MIKFRKDESYKVFAALTREIEGLDPNKEYILEVKPYRQKRSLNANAFLWKLCGEIAELINLENTEVYQRAIKAVGIYKDFIGIKEKDAETLRVAWERLGIGWIAERLDYTPDGNDLIIRCYYGSSTYNTKQMSRLLNYVIEDARNLGIEVIDEETTSLLKSWEDSRKETR